MTVGLQLGAPGVYPAPSLPDLSLRPVRLDVAGFAGIAPRGPLDVPTLIRSWSDYRSVFGSFDPSGLLAYAVSAFFEQGGERAYVVRVGPPGPRPPAATDPFRAVFTIDLPSGPLRFVSSSPGTWANRLTVRLGFQAGPALPLAHPPGDGDPHLVVLP